jgi:cobalamin biosynthesis protein CobT
MSEPKIESGLRRASERYESFTSKEKTEAQRLERQFLDSIQLHQSHSYYYDHGYRSGELHESNLWQIAAGCDNARPFSVRESIDLPDFHVGILVDCSGSMHSGHHRGFTLMSSARCLALGLARALDTRPGVTLTVAGHTEEGGRVHLIMVKRPRSPLNEDHFRALCAQSGNLDGLAVYALAKEMHREMAEGEPGMLILISDGEPCHTPLIMKKAFEKTKSEYNLTVFPIGVGAALANNEDVCKKYYGADNYVIAEDVVSAAPRIVSYLNSLIERLKPM